MLSMTYRIKKEYEGLYVILNEDDERVARVARFMPGPMVSVDGGSLVSPTLAKAIAKAMTKLANDLEREYEPLAF
jgi:hypothetical protein